VGAPNVGPFWKSLKTVAGGERREKGGRRKNTLPVALPQPLFDHFLWPADTRARKQGGGGGEKGNNIYAFKIRDAIKPDQAGISSEQSGRCCA